MARAGLLCVCMHPEWRLFLRQQGAVFDGDQVLRFDVPPADAESRGDSMWLADLAGLEGLIEVSGPDRREFLQGQVSTDIRRLTPELSQFSSWNNAKGRVVTSLRIFERSETVVLTLPQTLLATVMARLRMYVLRAKVQLADKSSSLARFGIAGHNAVQLLAGCGYAISDTPGGVTSANGIQLIRLHGASPRIAVHAEPTALKPLWAKLRENGARAVGSDAWTLRRILAGEPGVHPETSGHFVAQMLGLEELDAVHFNKGCYLGQEVIARAHYRGAVKRHLHRGYCAAQASVLPGATVYNAVNRLEVGEIVDAARDASGLWQLLAVFQDEAGGSLLNIQNAPVTWMA